MIVARIDNPDAAGAPQALGTDDAPNTTAPSEKRTFIAPRLKGLGSAAVAYVVAVGGTSITVRLWFYDPTLRRWFALGAATAVAVDTAVAMPLAVPAGALLFAQITANTNVTGVGIGFPVGMS